MEYNIKVGDAEKTVRVTETKFRELEIANRVYVVPVGVVKFIEELTEEIGRQQERKEVNDQRLNERIIGCVSQMVSELDRRGMLSDRLDAVYPVDEPKSGGKWTFGDEVKQAARDGLRNKHGRDVTDDLESPKKVRRSTV